MLETKRRIFKTKARRKGKIPRVVFVSAGQSPRDDIMLEVLELTDRPIEIEEIGALDGLDQTELELIRYLLDQSSKPVLFICRGMQMLNVVMGGTLHEHLPDARDIDIHRNEVGGWTLQSVAVVPETALARSMQVEAVKTFSGHHQAIKDVANGLRVVADASDGTVEAVEIDGSRFFVAVQWHPEMSAASDPSQQNLFNDLVKAATA